MSDFVQAFKRLSVKREALKRRAEPTSRFNASTLQRSNEP